MKQKKNTLNIFVLLDFLFGLEINDDAKKVYKIISIFGMSMREH